MDLSDCINFNQKREGALKPKNLGQFYHPCELSIKGFGATSICSGSDISRFREIIASHYDVKTLFACVCNQQIYTILQRFVGL